jgi:hypothetical protein
MGNAARQAREVQKEAGEEQQAAGEEQQECIRGENIGSVILSRRRLPAGATAETESLLSPLVLGV